MERRLNLYGVFAVRAVVRDAAEVARARCGAARCWAGGGTGILRGEDVAEPPGRRQTVSHSHILPPELRTDAGAYGDAGAADAQGGGAAAEDRLLGAGRCRWA